MYRNHLFHPYHPSKTHPQGFHKVQISHHHFHPNFMALGTSQCKMYHRPTCPIFNCHRRGSNKTSLVPLPVDLLVPLPLDLLLVSLPPDHLLDPPHGAACRLHPYPVALTQTWLHRHKPTSVSLPLGWGWERPSKTWRCLLQECHRLAASR